MKHASPLIYGILTVIQNLPLMKLSMAAPAPHLIPASCFDKRDELMDFHPKQSSFTNTLPHYANVRDWNCATQLASPCQLQ